MKTNLKKAQLQASFFLTATALIYQNFSFTDGWKINQISLDEKARTTHARELLGKGYEGSRAQLLEKSSSLNMGILNKIYESLPTSFKPQAMELSASLLQETEKYQVDPVFIMAVIMTESSFNPLARGQFGEIGLMQLKPDTAEWIAKKYGLPWKGASSLENPLTNIKLGIAYFDYLRSRFGGHANKYLSAYNMGAKKVSRLYAEEITPREYSLRVMKNYRLAYHHLAMTSFLGNLAEN